MATEQAVGDIVKSITDDVLVLVRGEVELAKAELVPSAKKAGIGAGMLGAAGYLAINGLLLLFMAGALGIASLILKLTQASAPGTSAASVTGWVALGFVIMAVILFIIAGILALLGRAALKKIKGPDQTVSEAKTSVESVKHAVNRGNAAAKTPEIDAIVVKDEHKIAKDRAKVVKDEDRLTKDQEILANKTNVPK